MIGVIKCHDDSHMTVSDSVISLSEVSFFKGLKCHCPTGQYNTRQNKKKHLTPDPQLN